MSGDLARVAALGPPLELIGNLSRSLICAAPGKVLVSADFSAIESRVLAWLAGETWKLETYRRFDSTGDPALEPYCVTATRILGRNVTPDDEAGRQIGKLCDLAFGYAGVMAFRKIAPDTDFTDTQIVTFNRQWRGAHPKIVKFWGDLHRMLLHTVRTGKPHALRNLQGEMRAGTLYLRLPSGRELAYPEARIEPGQYDDQIVSKDNAIGKWRDARGWHGTFTENVVQAVSRDLLATAMQRLESAGYSIVLHVHDEIVAEVPEGFGSPDEFAKIMTELPSWAEGLPLAAKARVSKRYAKEKAPTFSETEALKTLRMRAHTRRVCRDNGWPTGEEEVRSTAAIGSNLNTPKKRRPPLEKLGSN
jgi:DNA polymerase